MLDHLPIIIFAADTQGCLILSQGRGLGAFGVRSGEGVGASLFTVFAAEPQLLADVRRAVGGESFDAIRHLRGGSYACSYRPLLEDGRGNGFMGLCVDLTAQMKAQRQTRALLTLSELMEEQPSGDAAAGLLTAVLEVLSSAMDLHSLVLWTASDGFYRPLAVFGTVEQAAQIHLDQGVPVAYAETLGVLDQQRIFWEEPELPPAIRAAGLTSAALLALPLPGRREPLILGAYRTGADQRWEQPERELLAAAARSMTVSLTRHAHFETLYAAAHADALTGLGNRRAFLRDTELALERAREQRQMLGILSIDIDGLKQVNDHSGHDRGDALLAEFAAALRRSVSGGALAYRLSGDEFCVLMPNLPDCRSDVLPEWFAAVLAQMKDAGFGNVSASGGLACYPQDATSVSALLSLADQRMYRVKRRRPEPGQGRPGGRPG